MSSKRNQTIALPTLADAYRLAAVEATDADARDFAAQLATTELRRASHPGRATWSPTDQTEPDPVPQTVVDGDEDLWLRTPATGTWTMPSFDPAHDAPRCGDALTWQELAHEYGPLTSLADDRRAGGRR
ncbi:hypothetical protein [Streptomyces sp. 846.5]|uniref:hypothetical protein n=1 Tax=Streptacidiphilus sp. EB103A TaxID=3156275 RepID=UPI001063DED7|nr:hypothetical protein [Streptomyces sp. 846.5]TDU03324.1 hypothetical protein EDD99_1745 [Streptomyces sp. 846.5]